MKISVVIPSYGQAQYVQRAISSAVTQSLDCEIIVIDDGSTDGSLEKAKIFESVGADFRIIQQTNRGLASARNTGIMNAKGTHIFFLDADDSLMEAFAMEKLAKVSNETNADVVVPSITCEQEKTGETQDTILIPNPSFDDFKKGNRLAYCGLFKKSVLLEVGGYSSRYDTLGGWEDLAMWYDLMSRGKKIVTIQEPLVRYLVKEKSMWRDAEKNKEKLWAQLIKDFPETKDHAKN